MNKAVFLDRDGVLNHDKVDYVYTIEEFKIFDGVGEALKKFKDAGFKLIIITNQSGIAKGVYTAKEVVDCFEYLQSKTGNLIDDMFFCPHHPNYDITCECRKPGNAMILEAAQKYNINLSASFMVGDAQRDISAGKKSGVTTIHINNGKENVTDADFVAKDLLDAVQFILNDKII